MTTQAPLAGETTACDQVLYVVLELSGRSWKVLFATPSGRRRERTVAAREVGQVQAEIAEAKRKLGLAADARVVSGDEAGRDGLWLHRALKDAGVDNLVGGFLLDLEVPQRARRKRTDRIDLVKLMALLLRYVSGEGACGAWCGCLTWRWSASCRAGSTGSLGAPGTPFNSGNSVHEQGISKAGNRRMRAMPMEIAWCWLRYQSKSALSRWFERRFATGNARMRRIGIVALARKRLVALWRYLEAGLVPEGATLKAPRTKAAAA
jgi:hypothetical protein